MSTVAATLGHSSIIIEAGDEWRLRKKTWERNPDQTRTTIFQCLRCGLVWADDIDMPPCDG